MSTILFDMPALGLATVRTILGILFVAQAYDRIFVIGLKEVGRAIAQGEGSAKLPGQFIRVSVFSSSYIELITGALLIMGILPPFTYSLLALNMVMVALGFSYLKPVWDLERFFPRLVMLVFLMVSPLSQDLYRLGSFF